ncbi:MAG: hypothetical protein OJF47_000987 [Nitrospira sp.]|jgi:hypothetical protein|nr:MAG: hypothetical protein OJF47_000987 [Nitrospira sp.]
MNCRYLRENHQTDSEEATLQAVTDTCKWGCHQERDDGVTSESVMRNTKGMRQCRIPLFQSSRGTDFSTL